MSRISARYGSGALRVGAVVIAGALAVGCGGASRQYPASAPATAAPPPAASSDAEASKAGAAYPQPSQQMPAPAGAPMAPPAPAPVSPAAPRDESEAAAPSRSRAQQGESDLQAAERGIASSDCPTACRALGSMERAVVFLCASSADEGDARHCGSAKGRLVSARRRVRTTCGECPSGPSVDPDAPVPSRR